MYVLKWISCNSTHFVMGQIIVCTILLQISWNYLKNCHGARHCFFSALQLIPCNSTHFVMGRDIFSVLKQISCNSGTFCRDLQYAMFMISEWLTKSLVGPLEIRALGNVPCVPGRYSAIITWTTHHFSSTVGTVILSIDYVVCLHSSAIENVLVCFRIGPLNIVWWLLFCFYTFIKH